MAHSREDKTPRRYRLVVGVPFRLVNAAEVEVSLATERLVLPLDRFQVLLHFAEPTSIDEVHELIVGGVSLEDFTGIVQNLAAKGLLTDDATEVAAGAPDLQTECIKRYLADRYRDEKSLAAIARHLQTGKCLIIEDAFAPAFAEEMFAALDSYAPWSPYEEYQLSTFGYHHHNLQDRERFPPALHACERIFASPATKEFVRRLSNRDCSGTLSLGASLYLPGDYTLPHSDAAGQRNVTFIWNLTKNWEANWGGELYWCPALRKIEPRFNTLVLFNVSKTTVHFVEHVRPTARGRRFAINGWWQSGSEASARKPLQPTEDDADDQGPSEIPGITIL